MRCQDFERELAAPTGAPLGSHRAVCPRCDALAAHAEAFDRLWAATAPDAPSLGSFDRVWAAVEATEAVALPARGRTHRAWWAVPGLAAAAALLLALIPRGRPVPAEAPTARPVEVANIDVEAGQVLKIHLLDDGVVEVVHRPTVESTTDFELSNKATMLSSVGP